MAEQRAGLGHSSLVLKLAGEDAVVASLYGESGGHRWQRVPPTERRGRVHTSTVTVVVLDPVPASGPPILDADIEVFTARGSGPGGQHRNVTATAVRMRHRPTGIEATADGRSQHRNRQLARQLLVARVEAYRESGKRRDRDQLRASLAGSGQRGDKIRTYRVQDDRVTDHRTGRRASLRRVLAGELLDL